MGWAEASPQITNPAADKTRIRPISARKMRRTLRMAALDFSCQSGAAGRDNDVAVGKANGPGHQEGREDARCPSAKITQQESTDRGRNHSGESLERSGNSQDAATFIMIDRLADAALHDGVQ